MHSVKIFISCHFVTFAHLLYTVFLTVTRHWVVIGYLILVAVVLFLLVLAILCGVCIKNPAFLIM